MRSQLRKIPQLSRWLPINRSIYLTDAQLRRQLEHLAQQIEGQRAFMLEVLAGVAAEVREQLTSERRTEVRERQDAMRELKLQVTNMRIAIAEQKAAALDPGGRTLICRRCQGSPIKFLGLPRSREVPLAALAWKCRAREERRLR